MKSSVATTILCAGLFLGGCAADADGESSLSSLAWGVSVSGSTVHSAMGTTVIDPAGYATLSDNWGGTSIIGVFRAHVLIPHEIITSGDLTGSYSGLTRTSQPVAYLGGASFQTDNRYSYAGSDAFRVVQRWNVTESQVQVSTQVIAVRNIWLQEPDTFFHLNGYASAPGEPLRFIEGYYQVADGIHWTEAFYPILSQDATSSTVHFDESTEAFRTNPWLKWKRIGGNKGFRAMLDSGDGMPDGVWSGCSVLPWSC